MIRLNYSRSILNALFHTGGSVGETAEEEKSKLTAAGVIWGATPEWYCFAFTLDDYDDNGPTTKKYNEYKAQINKTTWWYTVNVTKVIEYTDDEDEKQKKSFTGWAVEKRSAQSNPYPGASYLALFTEMPDENGSGYKEPINEDNSTSYMRVDLNESLLTGDKSMSSASKDAETGAATITNQELVVYPEVYGVDWGTIVGIGIFANADAGVGTPVFWGRVNNTVEATIGHVPLFRVGDLKVTLK